LRNTRLCFFERAGCCRKGANCTFAHAAHDVKERPNLAKTSLCLKYVRGESCSKGAACPYAHGGYELRVPHAADRQPAHEERIRVSTGSGVVERPMYNDVVTQHLPKVDVPSKPPGDFRPKAAMQDESAARSFSNPSATRDFFVPVFLSSMALPHSSHRFRSRGMDVIDPALSQQLTAMIGGGGGGTGGMGGVAFTRDDIICQAHRVVE